MSSYREGEALQLDAFDVIDDDCLENPTLHAAVLSAQAEFCRSVANVQVPRLSAKEQLESDPYLFCPEDDMDSPTVDAAADRIANRRLRLVP